MATKAQVKSFIKEVGAAALKEAKERRAAGKKWILPGICVSQGAQESGWGTSQRMINANALFGFKVGKSKWHFGDAWEDKAYSSKTKEVYNGKEVIIKDMFRAYDCIEDSITDYMDLLCVASRYKGAANNPDPKSTITAIKNGGYATDPNYINAIMGIYNSYPEIAALDAEFLGLVPAGGDCYYPKYIGTTKSIVMALQSLGIDSSYAYRGKIAAANGITCYIGAANQNTLMLKLLKNGILKQP